jgi:hypothetical protein
MSVYTNYHSFNSKKADKNWSNFSDFAERLKKDKQYLDAAEKIDRENRPSDEELYSGDVDKRERLKAERLKKIGGIENKIVELKNRNSLLGTEIEYYIRERQPVESDTELIILMALADLDFGGKGFSVNEKDAFGYAVPFFRIAFPELKINEKLGSYGITKEAWIYIFDNEDSIEKKLKEKEEDISRLDVDMCEPPVTYAELLFEFMEEIRPVIDDCRNKDTRLILVTEGNIKDLELLERAQKHIVEIKNLAATDRVFGDLNLDNILKASGDKLLDMLYPGEKDFNKGEFELRGWK